MSRRPTRIFYIILFMLVLMFSYNSAAKLNVVDNPVDSDSDIDSNGNYGTTAGTNYLNSQTYNANTQNITEENTGENVDHEIYYSNFNSEVDSKPDRGDAINKVRINDADGLSTNFTEYTSNSHASVTGSNYFEVDGGAGDFRSSQGTIETWIKYDTFIGRFWGQDNLFETRISGNVMIWDWGSDSSGAIGTKNDWTTGVWYYVAITWDESTDTLITYWGTESTSPTVDVNMAGSWTLEVSSTPKVVDNTIMAAKGNIGSAVPGSIDEFRYWNDFRTSGELTQYYNKVLEGTEPNLSNYYTFDNTLDDSAGSSDLNIVSSGSYSYDTNVPNVFSSGYVMDQEIQFTDVPTDIEHSEVTILTGSYSGVEALELEYWDGAAWQTLSSGLTANTWNNFTIDIPLSTFTIRLKSGYLSTDTIRDHWLIDYIVVRVYGRGLLELAVDSNISDVDGIANSGTQSSFSNGRYSDGLYDSLVETSSSTNDYSIGGIESGGVYIGGAGGPQSFASSTGTISFWVKFSEFDSNDWMWGQNGVFEFGIYDTSGNLEIDWGSDNQIVTTGGLSLGTWYFFAVTWNEISNTLTLYRGTESAAPTVWVQNTGWTSAVSGLSNNGNTFLGSSQLDFIHMEGDDLRYFVSERSEADLQSDYNKQISGSTPGLRSYFRFENNLDDIGPFNADGALGTGVYYSSSVPSNYEIYYSELEIEEAFTTFTPYTDAATGTLSILTGSLAAESLLVDVWNGFTFVNVINGLTASSWNNVTITSYLSLDNIVIRFRDSDQSESTQSTWLIDAVLISFTNYNLDWEHQATSVDTSREYFELNIYAASNDSENFNVQMWDNVATSWVTAFSTKITSIEQWYNYTISLPNTIGSTMTWRYTGDDEIMDSTISTLLIDYAAIHAYDLAPVLTNTANDIVFDEGDTGNILSWTASDLNAGNYQVLKNGSSFVSSTPWTDSNPVNVPVDVLTKGFNNITIIFQDLNGNEAVDTAIVEVRDGTNPVFSVTPSNLVYNETTTGHTLSWTASDTYNDTYILYKEDSPVGSGSWNSGEALVLNFDGLSKGLHNYSLVIFDESGNSAMDNVTVTVFDGTKPTITIPQADDQYSEGTTGNTIEWTATDSYTGTYTLYRNGVPFPAQSWSSGVAISVNIDGLTKGTYNFTIVIRDASGNEVTDQAEITVVDTTNPLIDQPSDETYEEGAEGNNIVWTVSDNYPGTFSLLLNGSEQYSFTWSTGTIDINTDGLDIGFHNYTLVIRDASFNQNESTVIVHVTDNANPSINSPSDFSVVEGINGNTVQWVVSDNNPGTYSINRNITEVQPSTSWSNGVISYSLNGLTKGFYSFTLFLLDSSGNAVQDTIVVQVKDQTKPTITKPADIAYNEGVGGNTISWTASDLYVGTYVVYIDDVLDNTPTSWSDGVAINYPVNGLLKGTHIVSIIVSDASGNSVMDNVTATVSDATDPILNSPGDVTFIEGNTGNSIAWVASDNYPKNYYIYQNGSEVKTGTWSTGVTFSIDYLSYGRYNITLEVLDHSGNSAWDSVNVTVNDNAAPVVSDEVNYSYTEGTTPHNITWSMSDLHPKNYEVYRNGALIASGSWNDSVFININGLTLGSYTIRIDVYDQAGNLAQDTVVVTVTDDTDPIFTSTPADYEYQVGSTGHSISWKMSDLHPYNYTIYQDIITPVKNGTWVTGGTVSYTIDGLGVGDYTFTILIEDTSNNNATDTVAVKVTENPEITITQPNYYYVDGATGNILNWTVVDANPDTYFIYRTNQSASEQQVDTSTWTSGSPITYNIDGLEIGVYNFTLLVLDLDGNRDTQQLNVTVSDLPVFTAPFPSDFIYEFGDTGNTITWNATDQFPYQYFIYRDNVELVSGTWDNSSTVSINVDGLTLGTYNYTIVFYDRASATDTFGNYIWQQIDVTVEDTTNPVLNTSPDNLSIDESTSGNTLAWNFSDSFNATYTINLNTTGIVDSGTWSSNNNITLPIDVTSLGIGFYEYEINVTDSSGNFWVDTIVLHVIDQTNPTIDNPADLSFNEGNAGPHTRTWNPSDTNPSYYNIVQDGSITVVSDTAWNGSPIVFDFGSLSLAAGDYSFVITVYDEFGNSNFNEIIIHVIDVIVPSSSTSSGDFSINEGTLNVNVTWTYTDLHAGTYDILANGSKVVDAASWTSGTQINYTLDGYVRGFHNFTIVIYDESGNFDVNSIVIEINDITAPDVNDITDYSIPEGNSILSWTVGDRHPDYYVVTMNGSTHVSATSWTNTTLMIDTLDLQKGYYVFIITVYDDSGNMISDTVIITVNDVINPSLVEPVDDILMDEDSTENYINWDLTDAHPANYTITRDGFEIASGSWTSNVTINIDGLTIGGSPYTFVLTVNDTSGLEFTDTVIVTVQDNTNPLKTDSSGDFSYIEGQTGIELNWTYTDTNPGTYSITNNSVAVPGASGPWFSGTPIVLDISGMPFGTYVFEITITDSEGHSVQDTITVTVFDDQVPTVNDVVGPIVYSEGSTGNIISWTLNDINNFEYTVYQNMSNPQTSSYFNGETINYDLDLLSLERGFYNFSIWVYDQSGNVAIDWVIVQVIDGTAPFVSDVPDTYYNETSSRPTVVWTATDKYQSTYSIYQNGTVIPTRDGIAWGTSTISFQIPNLPRGFYNFTIVVTDQSGLNSTDQVIVQVVDIAAPGLGASQGSPIDHTEGVASYNLQWLPTDLHAGNYIIYRTNQSASEEIVASASWTSNVLISYNFGPLEAGTYNFTIIVFDDSGNYKVSQLVLNINDEAVPTLNSTPSTSLSYNEYETGNTITWIMDDLHPGLYMLTRNGTEIDSGTWDGSNIITDIDGLLLGIYSFNMTIFDESGNSVWKIVTLTVNDNVGPNLTAVTEDILMIEGSTSNSITWSVNDTYPGIYSVTRNANPIISNLNWTNGNVVLSIDGLQLGTYTFVITFLDSSGNSLIDTVIVDVEDQLGPQLNYESYPTTYEDNVVLTVQNMVFNVFDNHAAGYELFIDSVSNKTGTWISNTDLIINLVTQFSDKPVGTFNVTIVFSDTSDNTLVRSFTLSITDTRAPRDFTDYANGGIYNIAELETVDHTWIFSDENPFKYFIYVNNGEMDIVNSTWTSNVEIAFQATGLTNGTYIYTIVVFDNYGNSRNSSISVIVADETSPVSISSPQNNQNFTEGTSNNQLFWTLSDDYAGNYEFYIDESVFDYGTWISNVPISLNVDSLPKGVYNVTGVFYDASGNSLAETVYINILDETDPLIQTSPSDLTYVETVTGNILSWEIQELYPTYYEIYRNGTLIVGTTYINGEIITQNVDGLTTATYNYTIILYDQSFNFAKLTTYVTVIDIVAPVILNSPSFQQYDYGNPDNILSWTVIDLHPAYYAIYLEPRGDPVVLIETKSWSQDQPITFLLEYAPNYYNISIFIYDESNNFVSHWVEIRIKDPNVTDTIPPELEFIEQVDSGDVEIYRGIWMTTDNITVENPVGIDPIVNAEITLELYRNDTNTLITSFRVFSNSEGIYTLILNYTNLEEGVYEWVIYFEKEGFFSHQDSVFVTVTPHKYSLVLDYGESLTQGDTYVYSIRVNYSSSDSLTLNELIKRQGIAIGIDVESTFVYEKADGRTGQFTLTATTNENGYAIFTLTPGQTLQVYKILSISGTILGGEFNGISFINRTPPETFQINPPNPEIFELIRLWIESYIILVGFIIVAVVVFLSFLTIYFRQQREKVKEINKSVKVAQEEFEAVMGLKSIIMQTSDKLTVYEEVVFESELNTQLIGGMITAFSSFLDEIGSDSTQGFEVMEREGASITVHKGELSNFILISERKLPFVMLGQIQRAQRLIEKTFRENFTNTARGVRKLTKEQIYPRFVESGLKLSLSEPNAINERNINKIIKLKSISRAIKQNMNMLLKFMRTEDYEDGQFLVEDLVNYLKQNRMTDSLIARIIMLSYEFKIIYPLFGQTQEES